MIARAATTQDPFRGFLTMVLFGLGTVPALFLTGVSASIVSVKMRLTGEKVAAMAIIAMGAILIFKGVRYLV
jgi:sulfite exporter TauE/SafE